ncbi:MAG TPA: response regulator [Xanthobacteraceae bacterium]|nr:response regulator [Xanthobacteraceae bacterium]
MNDKEPVNILLVDDQPAKLLSYTTILAELGENLISASSGREALEHLLKKSIAVVLIDVVMPELDGFELATMIRDHPRFRNTAIIFVSAVAMTDLDRLRGYDSGGVEYVPVPIVPELLRAKVRVFADLHRKTRQLETLNSELERRVEERTIELAQANAELERRVEERTRERENAVAQVHQMQKLESLGQLTGGIAHDFNNLLMAILTNLDLLARDLPELPRTKRLVDAAIKAAERGTALTNRMLAFAKRQELKPEIVAVPKLVGGMIEMLRSSIGPTIAIDTQLDNALAPIRVDPNQLELAVLNLALNARDAMPIGGRLMITARQENIDANNPYGLSVGSYVCVAVADSGVGMDEQTLKRAPEPFFTTKGTGKGTGLGLSMVYGLAAQSGGAAQLSSAVGAGTTVRMWLPAVAPEKPAFAASEPDGFAAATRRCSVLLVDDDDMVGEAITAMLEEFGHSVAFVSSAAQALEMLKSDVEFDLVITDHAMPSMTGAELARRIRAMKPDLPIVLATGYADLARGADPGVLRLAKPFRRDTLAALLATILPEDAVSAEGRPKAAHPVSGALNLDTH